MKSIRAIGLAIGLMQVACSGPDPDPAPSFKYSSVPTAATLCRIEIGSSTYQEVVSLLGQPTTVDQSAETLSVVYAFGDPLRGAQSHLVLDFSQGVAQEPFTSDLPFPRCWEDDLRGGR